jgi:subtilisin-like proprotein convertase family protein
MNTTTEQPAVKSQASSQKSTRPGPAAREPKRSWRIFPALCAAGVLWGAGGQALAVPYPYENTTALAIPDNNTTGISQTINVTDNFTVNDLNVGLNITHTYRGDLRIQLTSPAGTTVTLIAAGGNANANYDLQLDSASALPLNDGNADTVAAPNYELDRVAKPSGSLSSFDGQNAIGLWTLNVADISATDTGTRNKFRLSFDGTPVVTYTGRVYHDINGTATQDGTEAGYPGVSVRAYNAAGALVTTVTTDVNGDYLISGGTGQLRVEFDLPAFNYATPGLGNRAVRFIAAGSSGNNLGIAGAADFCGTSPKIVVPCYVNGDPAVTGAGTAGLMDVIVAVDYNVANASSTAPTEIAIGNNVGAVWGMALQRETQSLFSAAFVKRHCGLKGSTGAIYKTNMGGTFPNGAAYTNLHGLVTSNGITVDTGESVMGARGLPSNPNTANTDATAFDSVGKVGLGGLAISDDGATLWVTNLFQRTLIKIHIGTPAKASITGADLTSYPLPALTAANGVARPFAVAWRQGKVYVGVVATGENAGGTAADVDAHLMEFNPATAAWTGNAPIFSFSLDYAKGYVHYLETPTSFGPWIDTWAELYSGTTGQAAGGIPRMMRPQPMFSDIDFLVNGDIVMSFCDRAGHQTGYRNDDTSAAGTARFSGYIGGDTLRARKVAGAWTLESNGIVGTGPTAVTGGGSGNSQGPGGGEFYGFERYFTDNDNDGDLDEVHQETTQGSAVVLPGKAEIAATVMDPLAIFSGGFSWWGNTDGSDLRRYQIYGSSGATNPVLAGKSNGLGALALNCEPAPIEIGDRVWKDNNANGLQDPGEPAIANVCVGLYNTVGTQVALAESDANGYFLFTNAAGTDVDTDTDTIPNINRAVTLDYLGSYTLGVCASNFAPGSPLAALIATEANDSVSSPGGSDVNDSDAVPVSVGAGATLANIGAAFTLGGSGVNVQETDFGFAAPVPPATVALGNLVYRDLNNDGNYDSGEGINGVTIQLYTAGGVEINVGPDGILGTADDAAGGMLTANGGCYLFQGLTPGSYYVEIPASEFGVGKTLVGFQSITGQAGDSAVDDNLDENGDDDESDGVTSTPIALAVDGEPTGEAGKDSTNAVNAADDNNVNLTVDFAFAGPSASPYCTDFTNPFLSATCFVQGNFSGDVLVRIPMSYAAELDGNINGPYAPAWDLPVEATRPKPTHLASSSEIGAVYGIGWDQQAHKLYASSYLKRKTAFGPSGTGAIYSIANADGATPGLPALFVDLNAIFGANTAGADPHPVGTDYQKDPASVPLVGKLSIGDIDLSTDFTKLYAVNMADRHFYVMPTSGPLNNTTITRYPIPTNVPGCAASDVRPFGIGVRGDGQIFVGGVCSGESTGASADVRVLVWRLDGTAFTLIMNESLEVLYGTNRWNAWANIDNVTARPAPMVSDISFEGTTMTIGLRDRFGDQTPESDKAPDVDPWPRGLGDALRAIPGGPTGYVWEVNAHTFYADEAGDTADEALTGSLAQVPQSGLVISSAYDAVAKLNDGTGIDNNYNTGGIQVYNSTTGAMVGAYDFYRGDAAAFGKVSGIGDIEVLCIAAPSVSVAIGNIVFCDTNSNGKYDAGVDVMEDGVLVQLAAASAPGTVLMSTVTQNGGRYLFTGLSAGDYVVKVAASNFAPGGTLENKISSPGVETATGDDNNGEDGIDNATPATNGISSGTITVAAGTLPSGSTAEGGLASDVDDGFPGDTNGNLTVDFAFAAAAAPLTAALGNIVFCDTNKDGLRDADGADNTPGNADDEPGIENVVLSLCAADGTTAIDNPHIAGVQPYTSTTDAAGTYAFTSLTAASYTVKIATPPAAKPDSSPAAVTDTADNQQDDDDNGIQTTSGGPVTSPVIALIAGETDDTLDFGLTPPPGAALGNVVFCDENNDGLRDADGADNTPGTLDDEPGVAGVVVSLCAANGTTPIDNPNLTGVQNYTSTTDVNGVYAFTGLAAGSYTVKIATPPASKPDSSTGADTADNNQDNDDNGTQSAPGGSITSPVIVLAAGEADDTVDFGLTAPAHIGNLVWLDENSNGLQDEGERAIANVTINVYDTAGTLVATTVTDAHGGWGVDVAAGSYFADVVEATLPAGLTRTTLALPGADFGNQDQTTGAGDYGYPMSVAQSGENLTGDFGYNFNPTTDVTGGTGTAALGDRVWVDHDGDGAQDSDEAPLSGVVLTLCTAGPDGLFGTVDDVSGPTATTDATGYYIFDGLAAGAYVVKVTTNLSANYVQTGDPDQFGTTGPTDGRTTTPVVLAPGDVFLNVDFGYRANPSQSNCVGDYVWLDLNAEGLQEATEPPIPGVTVALIKDTNGNGLRDAGEPIIDTQTTNAQGIYHFLGLPDGKYLVWVNDTDHVLDNLIQTADQNGLATPNISAVDLDSAGTNPAKVLDFTHDFGYTPAGQSSVTAAIGDYVWLDSDRDGVQDPGESPIEGVLVRLCDSTGATLLAAARTNENGHYWFAGLDPAATYTVKIDPANFTVGSVLAGFNNTWDADSLLVSPNGTSVVNLAAAGTDGNNDTDALDNNINRGQDFGYAAPAGSSGTIGNLVWLDQNADGVSQGSSGPDGLAGSDDDEPGVAGVTLDLYRDLNGNGLVDADEPRVANTVTNSTGAYLFTALPFGTYVVDVTDTAGILHGYWHSSGATGLNDNSQSDAYAAAITASAPNNLTADFGYYVEPAALGNYVFADADSSGTQNSGDTGIPNVEVTLTIAWPAGGTTVLKTLTDSSGHYRFTNLLADENHACGTGPTADSNAPAIPVSALLPRFTISVAGAQSALSLYTTTTSNSGANDKLDSDNPAGVVAKPVQGLTNVSGQTPASTENAIASYDFGYVEGGKASTFAAWQAQNPLGGANGRTQNPDGDRYNNFLEYAFCLPPASGANTPFCVLQTGATSASLEFTRPSGSTDATYTAQVTGALGNPTAWTPLVGNLLITDNGNGTETLTYSGIVPAGSASGTSAFYRIAVTDTSTSQTYYTEIQGWLRHDLVNGCETFACPLLPKAIATGFVGSVTGQVLDLSISLGTANLTALLTPGTAYYIEITSRDNEGHRFDIDARTASSITLANDSDLCAAAAPYNTKAGAAPASLTGDAFAIYPHRTIAGMFPTAGYQSGNSPSTGDRILIKRGNAWDIYWLYTNGAGPAYWDLDGDGSFSDMGADVVPVSQGLFVHRLGAPALAHLCVGEVRASAYCAPLCEADGCTLLAPGYPLNQSPEDLGILLADGWDGDRNPTIADKFLIWNGDSGADVGYACYWLADGGPTSTYRYWTVDGDVTLPNHDVSKVILRSRSLFMKPHAPRPDWCQPKPYTP